MKISDFLFADDAMVELRAADKEGLLRALAQHAASRLKVPHETFLAELMKREALGSTGLGGGVAIPHARFDVVMQPFAVLAKLKQPIDFNAIDDQPVDLVLLLLLPARSQGDQLGALACAARKLRSPEELARLRRAKTAAELYAVAAE
jgi:PTS system nitrogen regulatory IIA component